MTKLQYVVDMLEHHRNKINQILLNMSVNHIISLDGDLIKYQKPFEELLYSMNIPFSSQPTKDGLIYTINFRSEFQFEEFKVNINQKIPYPFM
jgi:hypothetical protein